MGMIGERLDDNRRLGPVTVYKGDALELAAELEDGSLDMLLTDPPYSSGGLFAGDRKQSTARKYADEDYQGSARFENFSGDNMDGHSYMAFLRMVFAAYLPKMKPGGVCACFTDWRQLATVTDALQAGGFVYRGIIVWDKGNSRGTPGRFRNDCEYVAWGTNGSKAVSFEKPVWHGRGCYHIPGVYTGKKHHQTEKPVELMEHLLEITPPGGLVCDPFMGSGSTGVAAVNMGRRFIGGELAAGYYETARQRIREALTTEQECETIPLF